MLEEMTGKEKHFNPKTASNLGFKLNSIIKAEKEFCLELGDTTIVGEMVINDKVTYINVS